MDMTISLAIVAKSFIPAKTIDSLIEIRQTCIAPLELDIVILE